jgi:Zn-dependent protease
MASNAGDLLALAPIWYVVFLFSTVCHEAAHALVAKLGGDDTAYAGGQVSLDPIPHLRREPLGLVAIPILTLVTSGSMIGWGSAPFNPYWQVRHPRRAALMALAGPVTNFLLAIIAGVVIHVGLAWGIFFVPPVLTGTHLVASANSFYDGFATFLSIMFFLNVILGTFNLMPVPPLDGYGVLGLILPEHITLRMTEFARTSGFSMFGLLIAWQLFPKIIPPVRNWAVMALSLF